MPTYYKLWKVFFIVSFVSANHSFYHFIHNNYASDKSNKFYKIKRTRWKKTTTRKRADPNVEPILCQYQQLF